MLQLTILDHCATSAGINRFQYNKLLFQLIQSTKTEFTYKLLIMHFAWLAPKLHGFSVLIQNLCAKIKIFFYGYRQLSDKISINKIALELLERLVRFTSANKNEFSINLGESIIELHQCSVINA